MRKSRLAAFAAATIALSMLATPAHAAAFSASLDRASGLNPDGDTVTVVLNDLPGDQGVYVRLCAVPADKSTRPTQCDGQGKWVSNLLASTVIGAGKASEPVKLDVKAVFVAGDKATVDCTVVACAIHTRRDHFGGAADTALDRYYPVAFKVAKASVVSRAGKAVFTVTGAAGKRVSLVVAGRTITRAVSSDKFVISVALPAGKKAAVSATVAGKQLVTKTLKG
jgi:hypothetical protein